MRQNSEALEEVDCVKYLGSQVAADDVKEIWCTEWMRGTRRGERYKVCPALMRNVKKCHSMRE